VSYEPKPIDTSQVVLTRDLLELTELLAGNVHEVWAKQRMAEGWHYGPARSDASKEHPDLVPYDQLTEGEKDYDRHTAMEAIKVILALGYNIVPPDGSLNHVPPDGSLNHCSGHPLPGRHKSRDGASTR
jgi:hypothetical protein